MYTIELDSAGLRACHSNATQVSALGIGRMLHVVEMPQMPVEILNTHVVLVLNNVLMDERDRTTSWYRQLIIEIFFFLFQIS